MTRRIAALLVLALAAALLPANRADVDVRILRNLEEAVPHAGRLILLVFFSTDCPSCYEDLFEARYAVEKGGWPVSVVGVFSGPRDELQAFLEKHACTLPVVLDRRKVLFRRFDVDSLPSKALLSGGTTLYRDDPYKELSRRMEDLKTCLRKICSR